MKASTLIHLVLPYIRNSPLNPLFIPRNATRRLLRKNLDSISGLLLDVGCGEREFDEVLAQRATAIIGLEYPPSREAQGQPGAKPEVYGDAMRLPFADESFDTVACICVLEHVPEPAALLAECRRVVKPGGHLLVAVPLCDRVHCAPYDFYRYTPYGLRHLAAKAGLEARAIDSVTGTWANVGAKISLYLLYSLMFTKAERYADRKARWWTLPVGVPLCCMVQLFFLLLDWLHRDDRDPDQYLLIARRPAE